MVKGRKPKPTCLKVLDGSAQVHPERINKDEPSHIPEGCECPEHLDEFARLEWEFMTEVLDRMGLFSKSYRASLELYCESYSSYRKALDAVQRYGQVLIVERKDGVKEVRRNPFSVELHKYKEECKAFLLEFGLTPSSKTRVAAEKTGMTPAEFARQYGMGIAKRAR